jgi:hypothetical protein
MLFDTRVDFVQGRRFGDKAHFEGMDTGEAMLVMQHIQLVAKQLEDGPKTVPEIAAACDLTESRVRQAIELAGRDDTIQPDAIWSRRRVTEQRFHGLTVTILSLGRLQSHVWLYSHGQRRSAGVEHRIQRTLSAIQLTSFDPQFGHW